MSNKYTFLILGGDRRQAVMARCLISHGHDVRIFGLGEMSGEISGAELVSSPEKAVAGCDAVILPLPVTRNGKALNLLAQEKADSLLLEDIVRFTAKCQGAIILGGIIPKEMADEADKLGVTVIDYYKNESLQTKNALPSAEGAIMIAMENTDRVIEGMRVLVTGYGRIARILAEKLKRLGAIVSVAARRDEVLCEIAMSGFTPIRIGDNVELRAAISNSNVIFNTVPSIIFTRGMIEEIREKPLYIEIASSPGGIDVSCARDEGFRIISAPSLPGRYSPVSAGEYIFETVRDILCDRGFEI